MLSMSKFRVAAALVLEAVLLTACATSRGMLIESGTDPKTGKSYEIVYSPYYEFEQRSDDGVVLARLVITLGGERVPKGYEFTGPLSDDLAAARRDGMIESVSEIYFINSSSQTISVMPKKLAVGDERSFDQAIEIPPGARRSTPPLVKLDSNYGTREAISFDYEYGGKSYHVEGTAKRLTVGEVEQKYGRR